MSSTNAVAEMTTSVVISVELNQSDSWPRSSTTCRQPRLKATKPKPSRSIENDRGGRAAAPRSLTTAWTSMTSTAPTGTLMRKIQRHS